MTTGGWSNFETRLAKGETVDEIVNLNQDEMRVLNKSKLFKLDVAIGGISFDLKPVVPNLKQISCLEHQQKKFEDLVVPNPSLPASQFLPL